MEIYFKKNIHFTRLMSAAGRLREFNFRQFKNHDETGFSIDVVDDRGERIMFRMLKVEDKWKIPVQKLPEWIIKKENVFHQVIEEETH
ncbi:MAG: hypothetical protein GC171_06500 [Terrimonas sp.]|nr:hypothetical protein [Terrimonas sp.]